LSDEPFEVADSSGLTDADWSEIGELKQAYKKGGVEALKKAMDVLIGKDPIRFAVVARAFFPDMFRQAIKDAMAAAAITEEDLREFARKRESPAPDQ